MFRAIYRGLREQIWVWYYVRFGRYQTIAESAEEKHNAYLSEQRMEIVISNQLLRDCLIYDIDMFSVPDLIREDGEDVHLVTQKGRVYLRKLIDEEKARRFEVKTLWVIKFWLPLLASLIGAIGAITGLVAVLTRAK